MKGRFGATLPNSRSWSSPGIGFEDVSRTFPTFNQTSPWLVWSKQFNNNDYVLSTCASFPNCATKIWI
jgi:hypothetical protein